MRGQLEAAIACTGNRKKQISSAQQVFDDMLTRSWVEIYFCALGIRRSATAGPARASQRGRSSSTVAIAARRRHDWGKKAGSGPVCLASSRAQGDDVCQPVFSPVRNVRISHEFTGKSSIPAGIEKNPHVSNRIQSSRPCELKIRNFLRVPNKLPPKVISGLRNRHNCGLFFSKSMQIFLLYCF